MTATAPDELDADRVPVSEARANLSAVIRQAADHDIVLMHHGRPAAVLMSPQHYRAMLDELDDLADRLAVHESAGGPTVPLDHVLAELGLPTRKEGNRSSAALGAAEEVRADE